LQTKYLAGLADTVVAIDPSFHAINRARARQIANATFDCADLMTYQCGDRFALVTACEVIYYFDDLERVYQTLSRLARSSVVTYYSGVYDRLDRFFRTKVVESETIATASSEWRVVWWRNPAT
jgi:trans-aconitate methyltransferase